MVEPVGITLGAVGLLAPIYDACDRLYHTYKLTQAFGKDFIVAELQLRMQYCRLDITSRKRLLDLEKPIEANDSEHASTKVVIEVLSLIKSQFELSSKLIEKYDKRGENGNGGNSAQSSISTNLPSLQTSNETEASSSTSIESHAQPTEPKKKSRLIRLISRRHGNPPGTKLPLKPVSDSDAINHPALNSSAVVAANQQHNQESRTLQAGSPFSRRLTWARKDKETLHHIIKVLTNSNNFLESILACKPPQDPIIVLAREESPDNHEFWESVEDIQGYLLRLHDGLRHMNKEGNDHGPWKWTIQLSIDYKEDRPSILNALYGLPLRDVRTEYFNLKRHLQQADCRASFFVAETSWQHYHEFVATEIAEHLDQPAALKSDPEGAFKNWGIVKTDKNQDGVHRLFHAEKQISHVTGTLPDMLKNENAAKMTSRQRVDLATLVAMSYIYFRTIRTSCQDIKPSSFLYYSTSSTGDQWTEDNPPILKPYLDFGFGQRPPQKVLGENSSMSRSQNAVIVELGLLLYQIGCCTNIKYELSSRALAEAKRMVGFNIHLLDKTVSMAFAEVTETCLQYNASAARTHGEMGMQKFLRGVVSSLFKIQEILH